jgi:hypothetical protein
VISDRDCDDQSTPLTKDKDKHAIYTSSTLSIAIAYPPSSAVDLSLTYPTSSASYYDSE